MTQEPQEGSMPQLKSESRLIRRSPDPKPTPKRARAREKATKAGHPSSWFSDS